MCLRHQGMLQMLLDGGNRSRKNYPSAKCCPVGQVLLMESSISDGRIESDCWEDGTLTSPPEVRGVRVQFKIGRTRRARTTRASRTNMQLTPKTAHIQLDLAESEGSREVAGSKEPAMLSVGCARA